jgi:hypothetical protein
MKTDVLEIEEKAKLVEELLLVKEELERLKTHRKEYAIWLEEMSFIVSHKVRSSIAHIQGISNLFDQMKLPASFKIMLRFVKRAAHSLNLFTIELSTYIDKKRKILKDRFL